MPGSPNVYNGKTRIEQHYYDKAGEFTYLCLTAPEEKKNDKGSYTTFNLINTADNYRATSDYNEGEGVRLPCTMIRQDTESEKLAGVLTDFFGEVWAK